jgi:hypothetical protein
MKYVLSIAGTSPFMMNLIFYVFFTKYLVFELF